MCSHKHDGRIYIRNTNSLIISMWHKKNLWKIRCFILPEINESSTFMRRAISLKANVLHPLSLAEICTFVNRSVCEVMVQKLCILHEHEGVAHMGASGVWVHTYRDQPWTGQGLTSHRHGSWTTNTCNTSRSFKSFLFLIDYGIMFLWNFRIRLPSDIVSSIEDQNPHSHHCENLKTCSILIQVMTHALRLTSLIKFPQNSLAWKYTMT